LSGTKRKKKSYKRSNKKKKTIKQIVVAVVMVALHLNGGVSVGLQWWQNKSHAATPVVEGGKTNLQLHSC